MKTLYYIFIVMGILLFICAFASHNIEELTQRQQNILTGLSMFFAMLSLLTAAAFRNIDEKSIEKEEKELEKIVFNKRGHGGC